MLRAFDGFAGTFPVLCALRLAPLLFVRPGELCQAEWSQFDLDKGEWRYLVTRTETEHLVPLSKQSVAILCVNCTHSPVRAAMCSLAHAIASGQ
ncbi:integrase [Paraburkholderia sp. 40]